MKLLNYTFRKTPAVLFILLMCFYGFSQVNTTRKEKSDYFKNGRISNESNQQVNSNTSKQCISLYGLAYHCYTTDPIPYADVIVTNKNKLVFKGNTDKEGRFHCCVTKNNNYVIKVTFNDMSERIKLKTKEDDPDIYMVDIPVGPIRINYKNDIPQFPWPPPMASAAIKLQPEYFSKCKTLKDAEKLISQALDNNEYDDKSYYAIVPGDSIHGFALATKLEQINKEAFSKEQPYRWSPVIYMEQYSFTEYLKALFFAQKGFFRVIVFVVTDLTFTQSKEKIDRETAIKMVTKGANELIKDIENMPFSTDYSVTALIYEYELNDGQDQATLANPSIHSGKKHLKNAKLLAEFENN